MKASEKIRKLIEMGTIPAHISKFTGVPNNTVVRVWRGETEISKIQLENAEKLASYYDYLEENLVNAIVTANAIVQKLDKERLGLNDENLYNRLKLSPYKVFERLFHMIWDPTYQSKLPQVEKQIKEMESYISAVEPSFAEKITLSDKFIYNMNLKGE